jgi:hypothetical protein
MADFKNFERMGYNVTFQQGSVEQLPDFWCHEVGSNP